MRHVNLSASIFGLVLLASTFIMIPSEAAEAQLSTASYQVIDLFTMSAGSTRLQFNQLPGGSPRSHYEELAAGGEFIANDSPFFPFSGSDAFLWNGGSSSVPLNPTATGFTSAYVTSTDGVQQIGAATNGSYIGSHATLWSGSAASAIDLNPSQLGATASFGFGVKNNQQVGYSMLNGSHTEVATVWNGSASSAVLLTSTSSIDTEAIGTDGAHQVGWVGTAAFGNPQAVMWTGTAGSMISLNPTGFQISEAVTIGDGQEGGYVLSDNQHIHPGIWTGSADSFIDLTPPSMAALSGFTGVVMSTNGVQQVGYFGPGLNSEGQPMIWSGTAASAELLPTFGTGITFTPYDIDSSGNIYGTGEDSSGNLIAIEWVPVPEPGLLTLLACGAVGLLLRRRTRA